MRKILLITFVIFCIIQYVYCDELDDISMTYQKWSIGSSSCLGKTGLDAMQCTNKLVDGLFHPNATFKVGGVSYHTTSVIKYVFGFLTGATQYEVRGGHIPSTCRLGEHAIAFHSKTNRLRTAAFDGVMRTYNLFNYDIVFMSKYDGKWLIDYFIEPSSNRIAVDGTFDNSDTYQYPDPDLDFDLETCCVSGIGCANDYIID